MFIYFYRIGNFRGEWMGGWFSLRKWARVRENTALEVQGIVLIWKNIFIIKCIIIIILHQVPPASLKRKRPLVDKAVDDDSESEDIDAMDEQPPAKKKGN